MWPSRPGEPSLGNLQRTACRILASRVCQQAIDLSVLMGKGECPEACLPCL